VLPVSIAPSTEGLKYVTDCSAAYNLTAYYSEDKPETIIEPHRFLMSDKYDVVVTFHNAIRSFYGVNCAAYLKMKSAFWGSLQPIPSIQKEVDSIYQAYFRDGTLMVGVHIRDHDEKHDWAVVPPVKTQDPKENKVENAANFGVGATAGHFARVMMGMNEHFNSAPAGRKLTLLRYFLASNSNSIKMAILDNFSNVISLGINNYDRNSTVSIQQALVELLLLSKSSLLLHTYSSTFAVEASIIGNVPLIGIIEGVLLQHQDTSLPYCGLPMFTAAYSDVPMRPEVYIENLPTEDSDVRIVSTVAVVYDICNSLRSEWGFPDPVYCLTANYTS
jgi:hypothetical protein